MNSLIIKSDGIGCAYNAALKQARKALCIKNHTPACNCQSCAIPLEYHPDLLIVDSDKVLKSQADEMLSFVAEGPAVADFKVVLVKHGGNMNDAAASALLKELEEGNSMFIICTNRPLLDTIHSRCEEINVSALYEGNDFRGLTYEQFRACTDLQPGLIEALDKTQYFPKLLKLVNILENINNFELLDYFGEFKEKDKEEFFSASTPEHFIATLKLLSAALCSAVTGNPIVESDRLIACYGEARCLQLAMLASEQIFRRHEPSYSKADFFAFVKEFLI